jgi:hypothetical protein
MIAGFDLWVHGYAYPASTDSWDGNWLRVTARCGGAGASVSVSGEVLDTVSIHRFRHELEALSRDLRGQATLKSHEPNLSVRLSADASTGHITVQVDITPDHMTQSHRMNFELDQSFLPETLAACDRILAKVPVRDPEGRGL